MRKIVEECLDRWDGYTGGLMAFGSRHIFLAYLGRIVIQTTNGVNATAGGSWSTEGTNLIEDIRDGGASVI